MIMGDNIISDKGNIISFTLCRLEKGREKICQCSPPHYVIDTTNRIVTCDDCGAVLDAFDALTVLCGYIKQYEEYQEKAIERADTYRRLADEELRRRFRNKAFKDMDANYRKGMLPHCPKCGELFEPTELRHWTNRKYYDGSRTEKGGECKC